jgi:SAM-dependent methyltransferase
MRELRAEPRTARGECVACGGALTDGRLPERVGKPIVGGNVMRCVRCGTVQVMPRPSAEAVAKLYDAGYYEGFIEGAGVAGGNFDVSPALRARLDQLEARVGKGTLLDVGCGLGHFVRYARDRGWRASGLETSAWAAAEGRRRGAITIHECALDEAPIDPGSLDVVHANHVFEHIIDPGEALDAARKLLRSGGLLVLEVPQELVDPLWDRVFSRMHPELYRTPRPDVTHHLEFFSPRGLAAMARRAGFVVDHVSTVRHVKSEETRLPLGMLAKRLLYRLETMTGSGPDIELWATAP